jgi:hypothetical protein
VRNATLWRDLLGVDKTVVQDVAFDAGPGELVVSVRPIKRARGRCGECGRKSTGYDNGCGRRRWRSLDFGTGKVWLVLDATRFDHVGVIAGGDGFEVLKGPAGGFRRGPVVVLSLWWSGCRGGHSAVTSATAALAEDSSTIAFPVA